MKKNRVYLKCFILVFMSATFFGCNKMKFDSISWKASETDRSKMIADLRNNYLKVGMSTTAIEALLDKPDRILSPSKGEISYPLNGGKDINECWRYNMTLDGYFDCHVFVIWFDTNDEYISCDIFCK